jgi:hypothetical protein
MTDKELWEKSQVWESSDDGRGKLKILESVEKFAELVRADEREECVRKASIALLGADKALTDRVLKAIRARGTT